MQVGHLVLEGGEVTAHAIVEVADLVSPLELEFKTGVADITGIDRGSGDTHDGGRSDAGHNEVLGHLVEPVRAEGEAVAQEAQVQTEVQLLGGLPLKFFVTGGRRGVAQQVLETVAGRIVTRGGDHVGIAVTAQAGEGAVLSPGGTELGEVDHILERSEERFLRNGPTHGDGREIPPAHGLGEDGKVGRIRTEGSLHIVAVQIVPVCTGEVGKLAGDGRGGTAHGRNGIRRMGAEVIEQRIVLRDTQVVVTAAIASAHGEAAGAGEGRTQHQVHGMLADVLVPVGEVLPLVIHRIAV